MKNLNYRFTFILALLISAGIIFSCGKLKDLTNKEESKKEETKKEETKKESSSSKDETSNKEETSSSENSGKLYFCEDYVQDDEVGVSEKFTTGRLTVMVKMTKKIMDKDVNLKLERIKDDVTKQFVDKIPFTIPETNYIYFKHKKLGFSKPGQYKVTLLGKGDKPIVSGEVTIVP